MSQQQDLRTVKDALSGKGTPEALHARLESLGIDTDLRALPERDAPGTFQKELTAFLSRKVGELSVEELLALTNEIKAGGRSFTLAHEQFHYRTVETDLGLKATFDLKQGQSLREALDAAAKHYEQIASPTQKEQIENLIYNGSLKRNKLLDVPVTEDTTFALTILPNAANKIRAEFMDKKTG